VLAASLLAAACSVTPERPAEAPLVWPSPPEPPRIAYLRSVERPDDLGIAKGFFQKLRDLLFGAEENRMVRPMAVVESDGILYVADPGARGVHRFDTIGGDYDLIRLADEGDLPSPVGLARGKGGAIYVADSRLGQILMIRAGSRQAEPLAIDAPLGQPTGIAYDQDSGNLFVVDTSAHCIKVFDAAGKWLRDLGRRGKGDGEFNYPTLLWRSGDGRLYVTDSLNFRIQIVDEAGKSLGKFGRVGDGSGDAARQKGVATDRYGHVYVVDSLFSALQVFDGSGRFLLAIGARGHERGEFWLPAGIFIGDDDTIYVADSYNRRVQVLRYIGDAS
jgi:DNA-binding beta-propeller fold protein YncE